MNDRNNELRSIRDTIQLYRDGVHEGKIDLLRKAFHSRAMMYGANGDNVMIVEIQGLYDYVSANQPPSESGEPHQCFISSI